MRLEASVLVRAILRAARMDLELPAQVQLAAAISNGQGVAMEGRRVIILLRDLWSAKAPDDQDFEPTLLTATMPTEQHVRRFRTTLQVAAALRQFAPKVRRQPRRTDEKWVPVTPDDSANVPLAGPGISRRKAITLNGVMWHNLDAVPIGGLIYRVEASGEVLLYQRTADDSWMKLELEGGRDIVNLPELLQQIADECKGKIKRPARIDGEPTLLRQPIAA